MNCTCIMVPNRRPGPEQTIQTSMVLVHVCLNVILQEDLDLLVHLRPDILDEETSDDSNSSKAHQGQ